MFEVVAKKGAKTKEVDLVLYGTIGQWRNVSANDFIRSISNLVAKGYKVINCLVNSPGGAVFEADAVGAIINRYQKRGVVFKAHIDGLAASAMSFLLCYMDEVIMAKNARIMIHQAMASADRKQAHELRKQADLLDSINDSIAQTYADKTGKEKDWILKNWMKPGVDKWFNANEAYKVGLCDQISNAKTNAKNNTENLSLPEVVALYNTDLNNTLLSCVTANLENTDNPKSDVMDRTLLVQACTKAGVSFENSASDEDLVNTLAEGLVNAQKLLADQAKELSELRNASGFKIVDDAVSAQKITVEQAKIYKSMIKNGQAESVKNLLDAIEPPRDLVKETTQSKEGDGAKKKQGNEGSVTFDTYEDYVKNDPKKLIELQNSDPEKYEEIVNAHLDAAFE
ncbi:head maturation protease, ClpP-related [uncultured Microscilla sp.]|uniref:head maturation protease, ClpP-related n=1 Tax=uncultured Microscilla sp. TaxID=432653 RepID=UPI00261D8287|nr:head maturation protease, ClpP-related [uncultured Microscilla sp.]